VSFAGISITVIVLAAIFLALVGLAYTGARRALLSGVIAFYPATLIFEYFPWFTPTTAGAALALWAGCFLVSFWALRNRVDGAPWPRMGKFVSALAIAAAAFAELVALYVHGIVPVDAYLTLPSWLLAAADVALALPILLAAIAVF
jgi:hypothetical protein